MIRLSIISFLVLCLVSCSGDDSSDNPNNHPIEIGNEEPDVPTLVYPSNDLLCTEVTLEFKWNVSLDPDNDTVSYEIEIASDEEFVNIPFQNKLNETSNIFSLEKGLVYYWRVKAIDDNGNESDFSPLWRFYTQGDATSNQLPTLSENISPYEGEILSVVTTNLEWSASDSSGETLTYDLYFGTDVNPPLLESNLDSSTYDLSLQEATIYYWKVIVKDNNGGAAIGPIWSFRVQ